MTVKNNAATPAGSIVDAFWRSWMAVEGVNTFESLHEWITERNRDTAVAIDRIELTACSPWLYDEESGMITNPSGSFFQIAGLRKCSRDVKTGDRAVACEQPILIQNEIGYLGIICREFDGVMHLLMQAKIEPGNVNRVQISPTIQATRSNFLQLHGGRRPAYLEWFLPAGSDGAKLAEERVTIVDQIQSEQSARFLGKRNRNVVIVATSEVDVLPTHMWMTIGQIKRLLDYDNLVNMDARTVVSCLPWSAWGVPGESILQRATKRDAELVDSILAGFDLGAVNEAYSALNDYKMFDTSERDIVPLHELLDWEMHPHELCHKGPYPFKVIYCDIAIEGREVKQWRQPLFEAIGMAFFGLLACTFEKKLKFLVRLKSEPGCFDLVELAPTVQREASAIEEEDAVDTVFMSLLDEEVGVARDVLLSEEGGRFFAEQNRNVIIRLEKCPSGLEPGHLPTGFIWLDYATLNYLLRANNVLNIQLRNLLALLDLKDF